MAHVQLSHLRKNHGSQAAVDDVSLEIPAGRFFTLLGPSGCGKSSTLRIVAGLSRPDAGQVWIDGRDVTGLDARERRIGMVFQSLALFPHMTVLDNVAFGLRMQGVERTHQVRRAQQALDLVQLGAMAQRHPHQLSGGQQQRVALARALVVQPSILILDEPFGALDRKLREAMQQELYRITRELGTTTLFVTHDQEEALMLSDGIVVMKQGRIEQAGTPAEIFERPRTRFVAGFMGLSNFASARVLGRDGAGATVEAYGCRFHAALPQDAALPAGELQIALRPERIRIGTQAPDDGARCSGQVAQAIYHGNASDYVVRLATGELLNVRQENDALAGPGVLPVGTQVWAHWRASAVHVLQH